MPDERICPICGRTNPIAQPRCINCGQRVQGVMLVAEEKPATAATTSWWNSPSPRAGSIPAPPQVREEAQRAEAARLDQEQRRTERERRLAAAQEREQRVRQSRYGGDSAGGTARVSPMALQADCPRCGVPLEHTASGEGFSSCLRCGAEAPLTTTSARVEAATAAGATGSVIGMTATRQQGGVRLASTVSVSNGAGVGVSPGVAAALSFFLPGLGQLVNGQVAKGALLFLASYIWLLVFHWNPFMIAALVCRAIAAVDAHKIAERRRRGAVVRDGEWDLG